MLSHERCYLTNNVTSWVLLLRIATDIGEYSNVK